MIDLAEIIKREPDFIIGSHDSPYMRRWYLVPRNKTFNFYLHQFLRSDDDRALHDHPWDSFSFVISGEGREITDCDALDFGPGDTFFREAEHAHRIEITKGPVWTLFITGPSVREWGFHCPNGWRHWKEFCDERDSGSVGKGCAD